MATYFIPGLDADFAVWQGQFTRAVAANAASLGLTAEALASLAEGSAAWSQAYTAHLKARDAAQAACTAKDGTRADFTVTLQSVARQLQANPAVDDSLKLALGLPVGKQRRRRVPPPSEAPLLSVMPVQRFQHRVDIRQRENGRRAKPAGVFGCELWVAYTSTGLGAGASAQAKASSRAPRTAVSAEDSAEALSPGLAEADFRFLKVYTRAPALVEHSSAHVGQQALYKARWVNRRSEHGPWSRTASATVAG